MEAAELVTRKPSPTDARAQHLHPTAAGKRIAARALPVVRALQSDLTAGFTDAELDVVARFLTAASPPKGPS